MADITMCFRDACPLGPQCRRSILVTKPTIWQSWAMFGPPVGGWCQEWIKVEKEKEE